MKKSKLHWVKAKYIFWQFDWYNNLQTFTLQAEILLVKNWTLPKITFSIFTFTALQELLFTIILFPQKM